MTYYKKKWFDVVLALVCDVKMVFCHFPMWYPGSGRALLYRFLIFATFLTLGGFEVVSVFLGTGVLPDNMKLVVTGPTPLTVKNRVNSL